MISTFFQIKDLYENSKPWYKWISKSDLKNMTKATEKRDPKKKSVKIRDADKPSSSKPVAFVVPSIVIVPGTPHANREPFKCKVDIEDDKDIEKLEEDKEAIAKNAESNPEIVINDDNAGAPPLISIDEEENTNIKPISLSAQEEKSRRFSKLPPAPKNAPNAEKVGSKFTKIEIPEVIQATELEVKDDFEELLEISEEDNIKNPVVKIDEPDAQDENENGDVGNLLALSASAKSRRFSKLPPSPKDAPNAVQLGSKFTKIEIANAEQANKEEQEIKTDEMLMNPGLLDVAQQNEKSRRFSKLPPAPLDAPNAVQLGSKFTMIPRDLTQKQ